MFVRSTENNKVLNKIISCLAGIESSKYFDSHLGKPNGEQREIVTAFQNKVAEKLSHALIGVRWEIEFSPSKDNKDSIDIFG